MKIYRDFPFQVTNRPRAIALGFFDGVHLGHQKLIKELIAISHSRDLIPTVFTFGDHPNSNFNDHFRFSGLIQKAEGRLARIAELNVQETILAPMIDQVKMISATDFFHKYLLKDFGMQALIVGKDARFGHNGQGNVELLEQWTKQTGIDLLVVGDVKIGKCKISSTLIREFIEQGNIKQANQCLGYAYRIQGEVVHGKKLGRTLGFPTLNIIFDADLVKPRFGVYASQVKLQNQTLPAITSIGTNPTVSKDNQIKVETYIYNKNIDLYNKKVTVVLLDFVRDEMIFKSVDAMKKRIFSDLNTVRKMHEQKEF
ncbi:MAG TPA: bifunctional riboflavin kinase/FAD synthetase [Clostridiaceae bacterium]|nr:bifunctional riboflavin kinase/FAD synthetase [Clostridiaceae bacterium]